MIEPLDEQARELNASGFLSTLGGMAFGGLCYLLIAGLFLVYFGATQGDEGHTVRPGIELIGWVVLAAATFGNLVMLRRFVRFSGAVSAWVKAQVRRDPADAKHLRLESKLSRSGRGKQLGPAAEFFTGSLIFVPFGLVLPYLALIPLGIGIGDTRSALEQVFYVLAFLVTALFAGLGMMILVRIARFARPLHAWRANSDAGAPTR